MEARWRLAGNKTFLAVYPESSHAFNFFPSQMARATNKKMFQWIIALCDNNNVVSILEIQRKTGGLANKPGRRIYSQLFARYQQMNRLDEAQVSDTTEADSSNAVGKQIILPQLEPFQKLCIKIPAAETFVLH